MTDKQIMIDGCDVSGCAGYYFSPTKFHSCQDIQQVNNLGYEQDTLCEQNPNCYYKQLLRKEQECEELNEELYYWVNGEYCDNKCNVVKELDQLKQTLTEIKKLCSTGIVHGLSADEYATNLNILKFDILQKISECEVEE